MAYRPAFEGFRLKDVRDTYEDFEGHIEALLSSVAREIDNEIKEMEEVQLEKDIPPLGIYSSSEAKKDFPPIV